jgi:iron complex outermembrane recepter protein
MAMHKNKSHHARGLVGYLAAGAGLGAAFALSTAHAQTALEEVIVTAQKRSENVQDVPISISAFTASALQERSVGDLSQLSSLAPNVTFDAGTPFSGSGSVLAAYIRGIGQNDFAFNLDPGVGVYLDGVYLARTVGANQDLLDVERVEVLKGPQGTLFGRNTIGGAISVVTRDPGDDFGYQSDVTTGSFDLIKARGSIDVPLSDTLKSSITVGVKRREGYQKRVPFDVADQVYDFNDIRDYQHINDDSASREGGDDVWNARVKLKWDNGGRVQARLSTDFTNVDQPASANSLLLAVPTVPGPFAGVAANNIPGTAFDPTASSGFLFAGLYNFCIGATGAEIAARNAQNLCGPRGTALNPSLQLSPLASVNVDADPFNNRLPFDNRFVTNDPDKSYATGASSQKLRNWGVAGVLDVDLSDSLAFKSITAFRDMGWKVGMDIDGSPLTTLAVSFEMNQQQISQEFQFNGNALDERLKYVLGLYYFREQGDLHDYVTFADGNLQIDGPNDLWTRNYGAFTQIDWRLTDLIGITVGGRYTKENKEFEGFQADLNGFNYKLFNCMDFTACRAPLNFPDPDYALRYYVPGTQKKDFNNFSPKVGVQLHPGDDVMLYASYAEGYKTGGWTTRLSNPLPADPVTGIVPAPDFDEEEAKTYEIGLKSQFFGNRLQVNGAVFHTDYDGIQLNFQQGVSPTIQNAGNARIKGAEIELNTAITDAFTVAASAGYTDAEYTSVLAQSVVSPNPLQAGVFVGGELPKTPETTYNISPRYEIALSGGASVVLIADYTRVGKLWNDTERTLLLERDASDLINASIAYRAESGKWDVTLGGTNLSDERFLTTGQAQIGGGLIYGTYNRPREWYLMLHVRE